MATRVVVSDKLEVPMQNKYPASREVPRRKMNRSEKSCGSGKRIGLEKDLDDDERVYYAKCLGSIRTRLLAIVMGEFFRVTGSRRRAKSAGLFRWVKAAMIGDLNGGGYDSLRSCWPWPSANSRIMAIRPENNQLPFHLARIDHTINQE